MRVIVFGKAAEDGEEGAPPTMEVFEAMERFTEELAQAGILVASAGLKNNGQAKRIVVQGEDRTVAEGPIAETRELVVGFSIWKVNDMDGAVAWAKRSPNFGQGRSEIEIRPFFQAEDMAEVLNLEVPEPPGCRRGSFSEAHSLR
ncbi:hypothetical protein C0214_20110 [Methylobacterium sp. DM1]|nr:hypothetical protein C0214_20110 [Methylobacterium sp. DM1]